MIPECLWMVKAAEMIPIVQLTKLRLLSNE